MIELTLRNAAQLFNTLDPFPLRERDLAPDAEDYLIMRAQEVPPRAPVAITISVEGGLDETPPSDIENAIHVWFASKADEETKHMKLHFRDARIALLIGICALSICLLLAWRIGAAYADVTAVRIVQESLVIVGWVVLWRPAEMLLYDWVPMKRRRALYRRLAAARVDVRSRSSAAPASQPRAETAR